MSASPVLVTIGFSHYCEKARWALDRASVEYREEAWVPVTHLLGTLPRGGRSTPLLALPSGAVLTDSSDILRHVEALRPGALFPEDPAARRAVEELEELFDEELGPHARRLAYHALLTSGASFAPAIRATTSGLHRALAPALAVVVPAMVKRGLRVDDAGAARSRVRVDAVLDRVEALLADGRRYLVGDRFTAADLTFAALYAVLVSPPEQPVTSKMDPPGTYLALRDAHRRRAAGAFALRVYTEERARVLTVTKATSRSRTTS